MGINTTRVEISPDLNTLLDQLLEKRKSTGKKGIIIIKLIEEFCFAGLKTREESDDDAEIGQKETGFSTSGSRGGYVQEKKSQFAQ